MMAKQLLGLTAALAAAALPALGASPYECNFLTDPGVSCMLPFPDNFFFAQTWNASAPRGLTLTNNSLPLDDGGNAIDPTAGGYNALQGFSPMGAILAYVPGISLDLSGLPRLWNISASTTRTPASAITSAILPVDYSAGTVGAPAQHWVEIDHSGDEPTPYERTTIIWPAARLSDDTTYIVAFRNLVDDNGSPIAASDGFAALRDKLPTSNPALEASRPRFERIFASLAKAGWDRASLTLAWDFTTNTQADITSKFLHMRDDAFARIDALGPSGVPYNITAVQDNPATNTSRRIQGQFYVPCYLPDRAVPSLGSKLVLDPSTGLPVFQEFVPFDFEVVIPTSVAAAAKPAKVVQYGHGLFGDHGEVEGGYLANEGEEYGYVWAATDWIGLSEYDEPTVIVMLATSFTDFAIVPDRLHQGMLNALVLMRLLTQSAFTTDPAVTYNGQSVISTNRSDWHYTGNSQGGIMGTVYMAATTDVERGVLGVGGGPYNVLLPRSTDFSSLFDLLKLRYPRSIDRMSALTLMQALWDRMDPSGWTSYIPGGLPNTPSHRAIWHYGLGDAQVSWLGCHAIALSAGAVMFQSNAAEGNETLTQFTLVPDSSVLTTGSGIMGFDFGLPLVPFINVPPDSGYDAHECPRRTPQAQAQMAHFFYTGEIVNTCGGTCVITPPPDNCAH